MNQALITGIEQAILEAQKAIAQKHEDIQALKVELEEARKPSFQPFQLLINVNTRDEAIGLYNVAGYGGTVATAICEISDEVSYDQVVIAVNAALLPLFNRISPNGDYKA